MLCGPPQQETFDLKPGAPGSAKSPFQPILTNLPGIEICELLPDLARQAHRFAIVRSVYHGGNALFHGAARMVDPLGRAHQLIAGRPLTNLF